MQTDDQITSINLQISKIDIPVICNNYNNMKGDVEKV